MGRNPGRIALLFLVFGVFGSPCLAQYSGSIQGVITDLSGAAVAGAAVTLRNLDTGIEQSTSTSSSGSYNEGACDQPDDVVRNQFSRRSGVL
jgi:carboxypeptidase family protein